MAYFGLKAICPDISRVSSIQIRASGTVEMDEQAAGREFADFERLSAAVAEFENIHVVHAVLPEFTDPRVDVFIG